MCYSSMLQKGKKKLEQEFLAKMDHSIPDGPPLLFTAHSFPKTPVILGRDPDVISSVQWGLIPAWAKEDSIKSYTLNARIETLEEKPAFKNSIQNRCLILADGFLEWKWLDGKGRSKEKYLVSLPNRELYAYAGLWSEWENPATKEVITSYTMVTTAANALMSEIHNTKKRMPVILKKQDRSTWLEGAPYPKFAHPYEVDLIATLQGPPAPPNLFSQV